jgi:predicted nucleic acid-binding protein
MPRTSLLLDACIAINLAATDHFRRIAETASVTFLLTQQAAAEVGYLRDLHNGEVVATRINLSQHATNSTVQIIDLHPAEYPLYLELARIVDDGEAATIAVAALRRLPLATDDRKARRLGSERQIPEPLRTLALIHAYADTAQLPPAEIRSLLIKIRDRASFQPQRSDPDHKWWRDYIEPA